MEKDKAAQLAESEKLLKQLQFIRNSKTGDLPLVHSLENSKNTSVRNAARKRVHFLENFEIMLRKNPRASISKGKSKPEQASRARVGDARIFQRF